MALIFALAVAASAQGAAIEADVDCITRRLPAEARASILAEVSSGRQGPVREAIQNAATACGSDLGWSAERTERSAMAGAAVLIGSEAASRLRRSGVPIAAIDQWFASEPLEVRTSPEMTDQTIERLAASLRAAGMTEAGITEHAGTIGTYVGARIHMEILGVGGPD